MSGDRVNHPSHYKGVCLCPHCGGGIEAIDITQHYQFTLGNAVKYILRAGKKEEGNIDPLAKHIEDLKKAIWYINREIDNLKKGIYNGTSSQEQAKGMAQEQPGAPHRSSTEASVALHDTPSTSTSSQLTTSGWDSATPQPVFITGLSAAASDLTSGKNPV